jgi:tripartite-type tricarboxylate transporter receptor subunit TctC
MDRRLFLSVAGGAFVAGSAVPAQEQKFPTKPLTIIVPYPAGGPVDVVARLVGDVLKDKLGQNVVIDNRAGGAGVIGTMAAKQAGADPHVILFTTQQTHAVNESLLPNLTYSALNDFQVLSGVLTVPHVLVARRDFVAPDVAQLISFARQFPNQLSYGSTGNGSASHLAAELFKVRTGTQIQHVPFRGAPPMLQELLGQRLDIAFATVPSVLQQIRAGQVKALAVASAKRLAVLPELPTLAEARVEGVEADAWFAAFAGAQAPEPAVALLAREFSAALASQSLSQKLAELGLVLNLMDRPALTRFVAAERDKWAEVIKTANIKPEN